MRRERKPATLSSVIFAWVISFGLLIFDLVILLPNDGLTTFQIALTVGMFVAAIVQTVLFLKNKNQG